MYFPSALLAGSVKHARPDRGTHVARTRRSERVYLFLFVLFFFLLTFRPSAFVYLGLFLKGSRSRIITRAAAILLECLREKERRTPSKTDHMRSHRHITSRCQPRRLTSALGQSRARAVERHHERTPILWLLYGQLYTRETRPLGKEKRKPKQGRLCSSWRPR